MLNPEIYYQRELERLEFECFLPFLRGGKEYTLLLCGKYYFFVSPEIEDKVIRFEQEKIEYPDIEFDIWLDEARKMISGF